MLGSLNFFARDQCLTQGMDVQTSQGANVAGLSCVQIASTLGATESKPAGSDTVDLEVGQVIADRYFINRLVGRGRLGSLYEARDSARGGRVAIRVLDPAFDNSRVRAIDDKEIKASGRLGNTHINNPVRIEFLLNGERCLVSPFLDGEALASCLRRVRNVPVDTVVELLRQLLDGLAAAQQVGVVHRDLTPRSVLIVPNGAEPGAQAKWIDFGISRLATMNVGSEHESDSLRYLSPEQLDGAQVLDVRSNLYSLGVIAYEALSGTPPFEGGSLVAAEPGLKIPEGSPEIAGMLRRALARSPDERFQSIDEMLEAISSLPTGDVAVLLDRHAIAPEASADVLVARNDASPLAPLDAMSDAANDDAATGRKLAYVPPPPLDAIDSQLAASRALATAPAPDAPVAVRGTTEPAAEVPYRTRQSTAPGIHPESATPISSPGAAIGAAEPSQVEAPLEAGSPSTANRADVAKAEAGGSSADPPRAVPPDADRTAQRAPETSGVSLPRVGSTARATASPTRAAKGTRAAALTRSSPPQGAASVAPRARPKVELATPAVQSPEPAGAATTRARLPIVLSIVFLSLAVLGIVFFLLPGRRASQSEASVSGSTVGAAAQVSVPSHSVPPDGTRASASQPTELRTEPVPSTPQTKTASESRDRSGALAAQPSTQKKPTGNSSNKKAVSARSKDPYNYR